MPKIAIYKYFVFFFYSIDLAEKRHLHVEVKKGRYRHSAKIFIEKPIEVIDKGNLTDKEINTAVRLIENNIDLIYAQIETFKTKGKVKLKTLK